MDHVSFFHVVTVRLTQMRHVMIPTLKTSMDVHLTVEMCKLPSNVIQYPKTQLIHRFSLHNAFTKNPSHWHSNQSTKPSQKTKSKSSWRTQTLKSEHGNQLTQTFSKASSVWLFPLWTVSTSWLTTFYFTMEICQNSLISDHYNQFRHLIL